MTQHLINCRSFLLASVAAIATGCMTPNALLAPSIAQPDTRPARNFTSFSASLECMDDLFLKSGRRQTLISSSDIPDETKYIAVGADDMLINAISQMNRRSKAYVFVDQALIKFGGLLDVEVQNGDELVPQFYIRGSISQLDREVTDDSATATLSQSSGSLTGTRYGPFKKLSVVSVDMHLVAFPSRRVLPGASVGNSMVVVNQGFGASASGLVNLATLGFSIQIERIESQSQAVRNLVEVGIIELLGRHAGVPYWDCLAKPATSAKDNGRKERKYTRSAERELLSQAQSMLADLGYLAAPFEQVIGPQTRAAISKFQSDQKLLPNGVLDFDLHVLMKRRLAGSQRSTQPALVTKTVSPVQTNKNALRKPRTVSQTKQARIPAEENGVSCPGSAPAQPCDSGYINLYDFLKK